MSYGNIVPKTYSINIVVDEISNNIPKYENKHFMVYLSAYLVFNKFDLHCILYTWISKYNQNWILDIFLYYFCNFNVN